MAACAEAVMLETRDKRRVNHMDPETKIVHAMLEAWGSWAKDSEIRAYPAATYLHRWAKEGIHGASQEGRPPVSMPDEIAAVDAAVSRLNAIDKKAIQLYYLKWQTAESHARTMHMRVRQFQNVLRRARWRLALTLGLL